MRQCSYMYCAISMHACFILHILTLLNCLFCTTLFKVCFTLYFAKESWRDDKWRVDDTAACTTGDDCHPSITLLPPGNRNTGACNDIKGHRHFPWLLVLMRKVTSTSHLMTELHLTQATAQWIPLIKR